MIKNKKGIRKIIAIFFTLTFSLFCVLIGGYIIFNKDLPRLIDASDYNPSKVTQVIVKNENSETILAEFYKERRYLTKFEDIPVKLIQAFISAEDSQFYQHKGVSFSAIMRAAIANFKAGHVVQGASTITMQLARSLFLTTERSLVRKIKEAILSKRIENNLTKQEILYLYLNQIYLGHGAYGVEAASRAYFNKNVNSLTIAEMALLAGMPKAPGRFSPLLNAERSKIRQEYVLSRMHEDGYISKEEYVAAKKETIKVYVHFNPHKKTAPYYVEHIRRYLLQEYGESAVYREGLKVYLPTSIKNLKSGTDSTTLGLKEVDKRSGYRGPLNQIVSPEEQAKFLTESRKALIKERIKYRPFFPDGTLGFEEAKEIEGIQSEEDLIELGKQYQVLVQEVNDQKKIVLTQIGTVTVKINFEDMRWAKPYSYQGEKTQNPKKPSEVLKRGDVVLIQIKEKSENEITAALDQVPTVEGALISFDVKTGHVLSMVGGYDFERSEFNRATQAKRQTGSAFKPIIFSAGIEHGYTPVSVIVDSPIVYSDEETGKWKPANFSEKFYGDTSFRQAFIKSRNIPTIKLVQRLKISNVISYAKRLGMQSEFMEDLSISLGSATASLIELTQVYSVFARLGKKVQPIFISKILSYDGNIIEENIPDLAPFLDTTENVQESAPLFLEEDLDEQLEEDKIIEFPIIPTFDDERQVLDPRVAAIITHLLSEVVQHGTGRRAKSLGRPAAAKTGTTNDYKDAWFVGFSPNVVTGVWVGYDDQRTIGHHETGAKAALPIWLSYMKQAVKTFKKQDFIIPTGVVYKKIDPKTGLLAHKNQTGFIEEPFITGTEPKEFKHTLEEAPQTDEEFLKEDFQ